ncbi:Gag-Pol polyprotein, partial [Mucuna pruriens]
MLIQDEFLDEQLLQLNKITPWFADICNYIITSKFPPEASRLYKEKLESDAKYYIWDDPYLWRLYSHQVIRKCILDSETKLVPPLLPFNIWRRSLRINSNSPESSTGPPFLETPINSSLLANDGIDFMGPFPVSNGYSYILLVVDYVSRCVEAAATKTNNAKVVVDFLKSNIFCWFGVLKALISDQGSQFCNRAMSSLLDKYGVVHQNCHNISPQTNAQAKVFNREIKKILQKMANPNQKDWCRLLEDTLWANRTAYWTLLGMSPYRIVFVKQCNLAYDEANKERKLQSQVEGKLRSRWDGPFVITNIFPYGVVELKDENTNSTFEVNEHHLKEFHELPTSTVGEVENILLVESA